MDGNDGRFVSCPVSLLEDIQAFLRGEVPPEGDIGQARDILEADVRVVLLTRMFDGADDGEPVEPLESLLEDRDSWPIPRLKVLGDAYIDGFERGRAAQQDECIAAHKIGACRIAHD